MSPKALACGPSHCCNHISEATAKAWVFGPSCCTGSSAIWYFPGSPLGILSTQSLLWKTIEEEGHSSPFAQECDLPLFRTRSLWGSASVVSFLG
jgi:hypothetical protein